MMLASSKPIETGKIKCENLADTFKFFESLAEKAGIVMPSISRAKDCTTIFMNNANQKIISLMFEYGGESCEIKYELSRNLTASSDLNALETFKEQVNECSQNITKYEVKSFENNTTDKKKSVNSSLNKISINDVQLHPMEKDSNDWDILFKALKSFVAHNILQLRVLYKENIKKYTYMEDDGLHLRVIIKTDNIHCELQIYKHTNGKSNNTKIYHDSGPHKMQKSHYVKARTDRKFQLPNCGVIFATKKSRALIDSFMEE